MREIGVSNHAPGARRETWLRTSKLLVGKAMRGALLACAVLVVSSSPAMAQAGKLDPTFGVGGVFANRVGILASVAAVQSNGKIVVGGEISPEAAVARLNANGTLDSTFGAGGVVSI